MHYILLLAFSIIFVELFILLKILPDTKVVLDLSQSAVGVMSSKDMTDREKEAFMKKNSISLMVTTLKFIFKFLVVIGIIYALYYLTSLVSSEISSSLMNSIVSPIEMFVLTALTLVYVWIRSVISKKL